MTRHDNLHRFSLVVAALLIASVVFGACNTKVATTLKYHCPMHPTYVSDRPGDCPICGMRLVPVDQKAAVPQAQKYVCPMHPNVVSDKPGTCPVCGMDLVPVSQGAEPKPAAPSGERRILYYRSPMDPRVTSPVPAKDSMGMDYVPVYVDEAAGGAATVPGLVSIDIGSEGLRLAGVQTAPAVRERVVRTIRTVGSVMADETRIRHVHTKISGWVEKLFVNFTGQMVQESDPLLTIYSRELLASQEEFLRAKQAAARFAVSDLPEVRKGGEDLVQAARRRLQLFDVPESEIAELERTGKPQRSVTLPSPVSGFVTVKNTFEGQEIDPSMDLFIITDLSRVWIEADFFEYEARGLRLGETGRLTLPYDNRTSLNGRISYIYPTVNPDTRTLRVRFDFPNPGFALKPAMFVDVELNVDSGPGIVIPDSAVIDTGERQIVFVATSATRFEPRLVQVGARSGGRAQVLSGLSAGDQVVIRANFLLDSESRLRAVIAGLETGASKKPSGEKK